MPVLEHVFAAFFNFVAFPQYQNTDSISKHSEGKHDATDLRVHLPPRVRGNNSSKGKTADLKRSKMDATKRRTRVFSMSLPVPPPLVPFQTPSRQDMPGGQRDQTHLGSHLPSPLSNSTPVSTAAPGHTNSKGPRSTKDWTNWAHESDVVGAISTEDLTKLVSHGTNPLPTNTPPTQKEEKKKGVKRKRSNSSVASISSSLQPLSKKISGLMARTHKKAKIMGNGLSQASSVAVEPVPVQELPTNVINSHTDIHAAVREHGCRLLGSSIDVDGQFINLSIIFPLIWPYRPIHRQTRRCQPEHPFDFKNIHWRATSTPAFLQEAQSPHYRKSYLLPLGRMPQVSYVIPLYLSQGRGRGRQRRERVLRYPAICE